VAELQARMSQAEFIDWMAYYQIDPFGGQVAELLAMLANVNRDAKKRATPYTPTDFAAYQFSKRTTTAAVTPPTNLLAKFKALTEDLPHGR
jgi:hypothetical protein